MNDPKSTSNSQRRRRPRWVVAVLTALGGLGILFTVALLLWSPPGASSEQFLVLDLRMEIAERSEADVLGQLVGGSPLDMLALRRAVRKATDDTRVQGLLIRVGSPGMSLGRVEEIRALIASFRAEEKRVVAVLESPDTLGYFLATAAEEIYLDRAHSLHLVGLEMQAFFLGGVLKRVGVRPDFVRVGEFKGAYEEFTQAKGSPEYREAMKATVDSLFETVVRGIAEGRGLSAEEIRTRIDDGPFSPERALAAGLVDRILYRDEIEDAVTELLGVEPVEKPLEQYLGRRSPPRHGRVAVVFVNGLIVDTAGAGFGPLTSVAGAEQLRQALRAVRSDDDIEGVVLRVDSPGGTLSASEAIWREIKLTADAKPVVVSMGDLAASGGYYIATAAQHVVAQRGTLTGSIGIFGGKWIVGDLLEKYDVGVETASRGKRAGIYDLHRPFNEDEKQAVETMIREGYDQFVRRVADGRKKTVAEIEKIAQGRVWTGEQAHERGLVDSLGGIEEAYLEVCSLASLDPTDAGELVAYPPEKTLYELLLEERKRPRYLGLIGGGDSLPHVLETARLLKRSGILDGKHLLALLPAVLRVE